MFKEISKEAIIIVQHNELINSKYQMSLMESRIFHYMLSEIKRKDDQFHSVEIPANLFDENKRRGIQYQNVKAASERLLEKKLYIENKTVGGKRKYRIINLLSECQYQEGEATIKAKFNADVEPFLLQLTGNFTSAQVKMLKGFKKAISFRMYWFLKQYEDFGHREMSVEELREKLGLEDKYKRYLDFRRNVLDIAQKELINTDMEFKFQEVRKSNRVKKIIFQYKSKKVVEKKAKVVSTTQQSTKQFKTEKAKRLYQRLYEIKLADWQVKKVIERVGEEGTQRAKDGKTIWQLINLIKQDYRDGKVRVSLGGYAVKKVEESFGNIS